MHHHEQLAREQLQLLHQEPPTQHEQPLAATAAALPRPPHLQREATSLAADATGARTDSASAAATEAAAAMQQSEAAPRSGDEPLQQERAECSSASPPPYSNGSGSRRSAHGHAPHNRQRLRRPPGSAASAAAAQPGPAQAHELLDPPLLSSLIMRADSLDRLQQLYFHQGPAFNAINLSAAITRLPKLLPPGDVLAAQRAERFLAPLCSRLAAVLHECEGPRQCCNVVWALGRLAPGVAPQPAGGQLVDAALGRLLQGGGQLLAHARPQELANLAVGLARLGWEPGHEVWQRLVAHAGAAAHAAGAPGGFNAQEVANLLWALAVAQPGTGASDAGGQLPQQLQHMARPAQQPGELQAPLPPPQQRAGKALQMLLASLWAPSPRWLPTARPQELCNIAWALATLGVPPSSAPLDALASALLAQLGSCSPRDLCMALWAFARLQHPHPQLSHAAASALAPQAAAASPEQLVAALWACAVLPVPHLGLLAAGLRRAQQQLLGWRPSLLAALASACCAVARLQPPGEQPRSLQMQQHVEGAADGEQQQVWELQRQARALLQAAAEQLEAQAEAASARDVTTMAWACAHAGVAAPAALLAHAVAGCAPTMAPQQLSMLAWAAARQGGGGGVWEALEAAALPQLHAFGGQQLVLLLWAAARLRRMDAALFDGGARAALCRLGELSPQGVALLMWAFAQARHYHGPLTASLVGRARGLLQGFKPCELANLLWALARLQYRQRGLFADAAALVQAQARSWPPKALVKVLAAYAAAGHLHWQLFEAAGDALAAVGPAGLADALTPHELAQLAGAYAAQQHRHERLLCAVAGAAAARAGALAAEDLCVLAVAMAQLQHRSSELLSAIGSEALHRCSAPGTATSSSAGGGGPSSSGGSSSVTFSGGGSYCCFSARHWRRLAWAFSTLGHPGEEVFMVQLSRAAAAARLQQPPAHGLVRSGSGRGRLVDLQRGLVEGEGEAAPRVAPLPAAPQQQPQAAQWRRPPAALRMPHPARGRSHSVAALPPLPRSDAGDSAGAAPP